MANTFNYAEIESIHSKMKKITGSAGDTESIAGILDKIDKDVLASVESDEDALFGPLGEHVESVWTNVAAPFNTFVDNFGNWSAIVSQASGNYTQFETDIAGFRQENSLGVGYKGTNTNAVNSSYYKQYSNDNLAQYNSAVANLSPLNNVIPESIMYEYSNSHALLTRHRVLGGCMLAGDVVSGFLIFSYFSGGITSAGGSTELVPVNTPTGGTSLTPTNTPPVTGGSGPTLTGTGANVANNTVSTLGAQEANALASKGLAQMTSAEQAQLAKTLGVTQEQLLGNATITKAQWRSLLSDWHPDLFMKNGIDTTEIAKIINAMSRV